MRRTKTLGFSVVLAGVAAVGFAAELSAAGNRMALMPLKRDIRETRITTIVEQVLEESLARAGAVVGPAETRNVLRRLRIRDVDLVPSEDLKVLADDLGADWLVSATLHDATDVPAADLALSARFYDHEGQPAWSGFLAISGLDGERLLGLGVLDSAEELAPVVVARLLEESPGGGRPRGRAGVQSVESSSLPGLGRVALLPVTGYTQQDALAAAGAATEAVRSVLHQAGVDLAPSACTHNAMRRNHAAGWGELSEQTRRAIQEDCGADRIVTGSVEQWETGSAGVRPRPEAALSLRLLDAASGRILWMDSREAGGWDRAGLFGAGRIYSRGALLVELVSQLTQNLIRDQERRASAQARR